MVSTARPRNQHGERSPTAAMIGVFCGLAVFGFLPPPTASAQPPPSIIIFGGGWGPEGTQQSIEDQVVSVERTLRRQRPTVLFADGHAQTRSVQIAGPSDKVTDLLGLVFNQRRDLQTAYRPSRVSAGGPANRQHLFEAIQKTSRASATIVFGVGHGTPAEGDRPAGLELWGSDNRVTPEALAEILD
ncbi:MAG: hypothetical protein AAFN74_13135, partial [Myxococcota bacterium]